MSLFSNDLLCFSFSRIRDINFVGIDASERFLGALKGVTDPEAKRKTIGEQFISVFEEEGKKIGSVDYLAQGTIYADVIESGAGRRSSPIGIRTG